ncbi:MAG: 50S ribosomal protein L27 [Candidatus Omnitrophica bacterium]|nr:50S ribosomal protein L27 [Candidatus Omnitrophota bacterium]
MGGRVGGLSHKIYAETLGIKVSGGQRVKEGAVLTREGDQWKPGINVRGRMHLSAACAGTVYFTQKRTRDGKRSTYVNIRTAEAVVKA